MIFVIDSTAIVPVMGKITIIINIKMEGITQFNCGAWPENRRIIRERAMSGSFYYGLKARFYGILCQLPWSFFVTACVLVPVAYVVEQPARILLIELLVYWTFLTSIFWLMKDLYAQRLLLEFSIQDEQLCVYKNKDLLTVYGLGQIKKVKEISGNSKIARSALCNGVIVTFDDGCEIPVFDRISNYQKLNTILCGNAISA